MSSAAQRFFAGDCFVLLGYNAHLWIVLSDPGMDSDNVVIVDITTLEPYKDQTCVLGVGDHPWIKHASCVNFPKSRVVSTKHLTSLEANDKLLMEPHLSYSIYSRIWMKGAIESLQIPKPHSDLLYGQGVVSENDYRKPMGGPADPTKQSP